MRKIEDNTKIKEVKMKKGTKRMTIAAILIGTALIGAMMVMPASADSYISDCSLLDIEGETYYLTTDIVDASIGRCIWVTAADVTLDCQGHTIDGTYACRSKGVSLNYEIGNTTIKNCVITDWAESGIYGNCGTNLLIENNTINSNTRSGIWLNTISSSTVTNNTISSNDPSSVGIYMTYGSSNNKIYNNLFSTTENILFEYGTVATNIWNTTRQAGERIYTSGAEIGGNYWTNPSGTGYSDTCTDADKDGFCDDPYTLATDNVDYLPLSDEAQMPAAETVTLSDPVDAHYTSYSQNSGSYYRILMWDIWFGNDEETSTTRGYVEWDISSIPDEATITSVVFKYHGYEHWIDGHIHAMANKPSAQSNDPTGNGVIYNDAGDGTVYADPAGFPELGPQKEVDLGLDAASDLQAALVNDWFAIGLQSDAEILGSDVGSCILGIYTIPDWVGTSADPKPTIEVTYTVPALIPDLTPKAITVPALFPDEPNAIGATIANVGALDASSFNVSLSADGTVVDKIRIDSLGAGASIDVSFSWTPASTGDHQLCVFADSDTEVDEGNEDNNELCEDVTVPVNLVYLVPEDSGALYCCEAEVEIWVEAGDSFQGGQINLAYTHCCANVTNVEFNTAVWPYTTWYSENDGSEWITFRRDLPMVNGTVLIGTLTIHCCDEDICDTELHFTGKAEAVAEGHTRYCMLSDDRGNALDDTGWHDGTFKCPVRRFIPASVTFDKKKLDLNSSGILKAFITLPEGYNATVAQINVSTVECEGAEAFGDGSVIPGKQALEVKFKIPEMREDLATGANVTMTVTGELYDGTPFEGSNTLKVVYSGKTQK